ncbi:hypothetical protein QCA50_015158 [Cerrena zonata]|uniref:Cytochrome P450 n=1 Tax=Cerrena zonata TaxID=2478898 RepID=A0AAW0FWS2_9APHY
MITLVDIVIVLIVGFYYLRKIGTRGPGLPPGPPTLPLVGNIHQFPKERLWLRFTEWSREYGGIVSLKIASQTAIIVTSPRIVRDLMDKRGKSLSNRPQMKLADSITDGLNIGFSQGHIWKLQRRAVQSLLSHEACNKHIPIQKAEAIQFAYDLLKDPKNFFEHTQRQFASVMLSTIFGTRCPRYENSLASEFFSIERDFDELLAPGAHPPIDVIPILQYVPERWAPWKTICRDLRRRQQTFYHRLMNACEQRMKNGRNNGCFLEDIINNRESMGLSREMVAYMGGVSLEGGSNTIATFIHRFILCMMCHPDTQRRGQDEVDKVVGPERMPQMEDIANMPYVQAIIKEVHRFYPTAPLAIPHSNATDESVDGYFIPKDSIVFMNIYGIYHNEELYDEPHTFRPERFLDSEFGTKADADITGLRSDIHFGSGRRICPGMHLANNAVVMNVLNLLWSFDMTKAKEDIRDPFCPITLEDFVPGLTIGPKPFECNIQPRSDKRAALIRAAFSEARSIFSMFEQELTDDEKVFVERW